MSKEIPIYQIQQFKALNLEDEFYANTFDQHVEQHHFTQLPHRHDFYLVVLITQGTGVHEIDFNSFEVRPGMVFFLKPGQMHYWEFSADINGYVFFHTRSFFDERYLASHVHNFPLYNQHENIPYIDLEPGHALTLQSLMSDMVLEYRENKSFKWQRIHALLTLSLIEVSRAYPVQKVVFSEGYWVKVRNFQDLVERHYKAEKRSSQYAEMLNISEKHLNRICKQSINKTSSQIIQERVLLEAKRLLMHIQLNVNEISSELGFSDSSYFIRFFKKHENITPLQFQKAYKMRS